MKLFGTDGVRGRFGREPITPQTLLKLGWAFGSVLQDHSDSSHEVVIGKDTRVSGYLMETALTSGLLSSGVNIALLGPIPTPGVSYFCRYANASAGIVISASHNPAPDNGIKLLHAGGSKLPSCIEKEIEHKMGEPIQVVELDQLGKARRIDHAVDIYADYLSRYSVRLDGLKIALDCANGASYRVAPSVLRQLGVQVFEGATNPDGYNINLNCGSTNPEFIRDLTLKHKADVGIALDGDGDRVLMVDSEGNLVNGDHILYVIALGRKREGSLKGGVVGTLLSNIGLAEALTDNQIPFMRSKVGDRYISEHLEKLDWNLGGEQCGHIINGEIGIPGDGILAALEVLTEMVRTERTLSELVEGMSLVPQVSKDIALKLIDSPLEVFDLNHWPLTSRAIRQAESELNNHGRVLLRASGTEPAIRVLVEGPDHQQNARIAEQLAEVVRQESVQLIPQQS